MCGSEVIAITITAHFADLSDPRGHCNARLHSFHDILVISLCATICGAECFTDMEAFGQAKEEWFRQQLGLALPHGIPSHDTFARIFARLDPQEFAGCFQRWSQSLQHQTKGQVIAVDGKTLRRSFDSATGKGALHVVSAWASHNRLVLGQQAVDQKSNEIKAVPALLRMLDLAGCIVTVDALNCQKEIAGQILRQQGDYLFALKGNHRWLHEDVVAHFDWALERVRKGAKAATMFKDYAATQNYGHGRSERRRCWCLSTDSGEWNEAVAQWPGLKTLVMIESERRLSRNVPEMGESGVTVWSEPTIERRYYLSSLPPNAERVLDAVRQHWGIENSLHWVLDVVFAEDSSRIRKDHAAANTAMLRHLTLNLLRLDTTHKRGLKSKRLRAGWDHDYLRLILAGPNL